MPWQKSYNHDLAIGRAMNAFWANGYAATSISDLVAATGLNRASLYSAFKDKRGLFIATLKAYDAMRREKRTEPKLCDDPRSQILDMFRAAVSAPKNAPPGCLLVNAGLELGPHDKEVSSIVSDALASARDYLQELIQDAQKDGTIRREFGGYWPKSTLMKCPRSRFITK